MVAGLAPPSQSLFFCFLRSIHGASVALRTERDVEKKKEKKNGNMIKGQRVVGSHRAVNIRAGWHPGNPERNGRGLLTCQLVSGSPETIMRKIVRRGRGKAGRSVGPGKFSLRRGPRANCTVSRSPLKSEPSTRERQILGYCGMQAI